MALSGVSGDGVQDLIRALVPHVLARRAASRQPTARRTRSREKPSSSRRERERWGTAMRAAATNPAEKPALASAKRLVVKSVPPWWSTRTAALRANGSRARRRRRRARDARRRGAHRLVRRDRGRAAPLGLTRRRLSWKRSRPPPRPGRSAWRMPGDAGAPRHPVAQVLLTPEDTEERRRHLNARSTVAQLLKLGAVPVFNENDTVATEEIRFGDNDRLAARVAQMASADTLVLLSDIDGLYTGDPRRDAQATRLDEVHEVTAEIKAMAGAAGTAYSLGRHGDQARRRQDRARRRLPHGDRARHRRQPLAALERGAPCTWFLPSTSPKTARKRWIAGSLRAAGRADRRRWSAGGAARGQEPAAGRRARDRGRLPARRSRRGARGRRPRGRRAACRRIRLRTCA